MRNEANGSSEEDKISALTMIIQAIILAHEPTLGSAWETPTHGLQCVLSLSWHAEERKGREGTPGAGINIAEYDTMYGEESARQRNANGCCAYQKLRCWSI